MLNVTFEGGTRQQIDWVNEAIALCAYPLDALAPVIVVNWSDQFPTNADTRHPYMVTVARGDGSFLITIASWADDPGNPNNQGLPNPRADIKDFYMQSFVHELGHVAVESTLDPLGVGTDPRVQQMCGYFWRTQVDSGSGRRLGGPGDWSAAGKDWPDMVKEAVAEVFKCAFFNGRLIFTNRTNWNIDESNWANYLALLSVPGGIQPVEYDNSFGDLLGLVLATDLNGVVLAAPNVSAGAGLLVQPPEVAIFGKSMPLLESFDTTVKVGAVPRVTETTALLGPNLGVGDAGGDTLHPPPSLHGAWLNANWVGDQFPYWLRLTGAISGNLQTELWDIDPWTAPRGSLPVLVSDWSSLYGPILPVPIIVCDTAGQASTGQWQIDQWRTRTFRDFTAVSPGAAYPFGNARGQIAAGAAAQGLIRIGR